MTERKHTHEEGQRVHYLANLGGLVVIAGLEKLPPTILVGALAEVAKRFTQLSPERIETLKEKGAVLLQHRAAEKRSFKEWQRAQQTERFDFTRDQMTKLIVALGGCVPTSEKEWALELKRLVRGL
jgi:hypothetical protein